jgi:hypothetical protein
MRSDLAFFVRLLLPMPALCQDTPPFRANLDHTGVYGAAGVPMFTGVKWKFQTNGRVISSPSVENGLAYVGSMDKNLYAVDQQTAALKLKFATEGPVVSSPALAGGIVYFASYDGKSYVLDGKVFFGTSIPGLLHAVDAKTGAEMFSIPSSRFLPLSRLPTECSISAPSMESSLRWI